MDHTPLNQEERAEVLHALNTAARQFFPGLLAPIEEVSRLAEFHYKGLRIKLDDLPPEVIGAIGPYREHWRKALPNASAAADSSAVANVLMRHLFHYDHESQRFFGPLNEIVWPAIEHVSKGLDPPNLRILWDRMVDSRVESHLCVDLILNLARDFCEDSWADRPVRFAEISVFKNVWGWPSPLPASEAFAVRQVLELAAATQALSEEAITSWSQSIANFALAERSLDAANERAMDTSTRETRAELFARKTHNLEGIVLCTPQELEQYVDMIEEQEQDYYRRVLDLNSVPSLSELRAISAFLTESDFDRRKGMARTPEWRRVHKRWKNSVQMFMRVTHDVFRALRQLLPAMFYVDEAAFDSQVGHRLLEQVQRWLYYWSCHNNRYDKCESSFDSDEIASFRLLLDVVKAWHESPHAPEKTLARARELLVTEPAKSWRRSADPETNSHAFWLLPLWLLELRALRQFGRGSLEWQQANELAVERLAFLACRVNLAQFWSSDPSTVLFTLESLRQVAVARAELNRPGVWDPEMLRCARQILMRIEMIESAEVRRSLTDFLYPVLAAIASWRTATSSDPLEGLCLFQMARSRWLVDHLALGDRTLSIRPDDDALTRENKDRLFHVLNPQLQNTDLSQWQEVPDDLRLRLRRESPDLARLAAANWLSPSEVRRRIPSEAVMLAYEIEDNPAARHSSP